MVCLHIYAGYSRAVDILPAKHQYVLQTASLALRNPPPRQEGASSSLPSAHGSATDMLCGPVTPSRFREIYCTHSVLCRSADIYAYIYAPVGTRLEAVSSQHCDFVLHNGSMAISTRSERQSAASRAHIFHSSLSVP